MKTSIKNLFLLPVLMATLGLMPTGSGVAQTFTTLHGFTAPIGEPNNNSDGAYPNAGLILSGNTLYGTTGFGGIWGNGTVFAVNTDGTGFTTLHGFTPSYGNAGISPYPGANTDGSGPQAGLILLGNTLYGTASEGGISGNGTVFAVNTDGTGFTTLHGFTPADPVIGTNSDGALPIAGLILSGNTLYGTAYLGGNSGNGTVFAVNTDATGFTNLHNFTTLNDNTNSDGAYPQAALILSGNTLYGTAFSGGNSGNGTVFKVNTDGTGFTNLYDFTGLTDGANPSVGLVLSGNSLYGTENEGVFAINTDGTGFRIVASDGGGPLILSGNTLFGATYEGVFAVNTDGTGFTNLYSFNVFVDGYNPQIGFLSGNTLYGTSQGGSGGNGTVFAVNTDGTGFMVLHSFTAISGPFSPFTNSDGAGPNGVTLSGNTLYGTAVTGGSSDNGTVFAVNTDGTGFTTLHNFTGGSDGGGPLAGLILSGNTLYGTTYTGGSSQNGTVFALNADSTSYKMLHNFTAFSGSDGTNSDGTAPFAGLILSGNTLYGTAVGGGSSGNGTVFAVNTDGTGFTTLHNFTAGSGPLYFEGPNSDGAAPEAGLILSANTLYGTAYGGGSSGVGTVFKLNTDGKCFTTLHSFVATANFSPYTNSDGAYPEAGLVLSANTLYGTASEGGSSGGGTVFKVNTDGTDFATLYNFTGGSDGASPAAGLVLSGKTLYGTTGYGGNSGFGAVFAINTDGTDFTTLYSFTGGSDGGGPLAGLILSAYTLYGTASDGGSSENGTVFSLSFAPQLAINLSATNVVLTWPISVDGFNYASFNLQSTPILSPAAWNTNLPAPVIVNGQNTVTNPISGTQQFYQLSQ